MRSYLLCVVFIFSILTCISQKPSIDANAIKGWTSLGGGRICNNGHYAEYEIENQPAGNHTLVIVDTKNKWKLDLPGCNFGFFSSDSKYAFFKKGKDSLGIIKTGEGIVRSIPFVQSYTISRTENANWLIYQLANFEHRLVVYNIQTEKEISFDFVNYYSLSEDGRGLVFVTDEKNGAKANQLHWLNLATGDTKVLFRGTTTGNFVPQYCLSSDARVLVYLTEDRADGSQELHCAYPDSEKTTIIWKGAKAGNFVLDNNNKQLAFTVEQSSNKQALKTFWYYKIGVDKAIRIVVKSYNKNETDLLFDNIRSFSEDDSCLIITLREKGISKSQPSPVVVWSYSDTMLQSKQLDDLNKANRTFRAIINLKTHDLFRLEEDGERLVDHVGDLGLILSRPGDNTEDQWNMKASRTIWLISTKNGIRKQIPGVMDLQAKISPNGTYVIYYDFQQKNYFSYEIASGFSRNITKGVQVSWLGYYKDMPTFMNGPRGIAGWIKNDEAVLIYDENDIWQIDMSGKKKPINITSGYGKKHSILFSLDLPKYNSELPGYNGPLSSNERLILNAFNLENKDNGYFAKILSKPGDPELLKMGPYVYDISKNPFIPLGINFIPVKAENAEVYLVRRMSASEAPNFFTTSDFKTFSQISNFHPEKNYNWLTSELVTWKALDGDSLQGILYKQENFDPRKKYPVIFNYYQRKSDGLHAFLEPDISSADINIPWYVSNGYLVFLPDIHYKIGETGESVINSVVSAAQHLSKLPYVDSKKMGIEGFSFGGYETNYLVSHSNMFAAACSGSGISNFVSLYGSLHGDGRSEQEIIQYRIYRLGATLWQRPELYLKNSPVFAADKVTTPFLMMHTRQDEICPFVNAIEFFTALRRVGKKVWMLQYEGNHFPADPKDYSIRMQQFFDHYLKDSAAPRWMMYGIPAAQKGFDNGLELVKEKDPKTGKWVTPKESTLLTDEEKKKVQTLQKRKSFTVTIN